MINQVLPGGEVNGEGVCAGWDGWAPKGDAVAWGWAPKGDVAGWDCWKGFGPLAWGALSKGAFGSAKSEQNWEGGGGGGGGGG